MLVGQIKNPAVGVILKKGDGTYKQLGIQAPPLSHFKINEADIYIGSAGIYELFDDITVESLEFISQSSAGDIYIDYVKEE